MLFNSYHFLFFFIITTLIYFILPRNRQWLFLLAASYYFYASWRFNYLFLLLAQTVVVYTCGLVIGRSTSQTWRKMALLFAIGLTMGTLFLFKYYNFFDEQLSALLKHYGLSNKLPHIRLLLPIGISFYSFQAVSYVIDVYHGRKKAELHFGRFALFKSFYPQLVAGPIERATHLLPQFNRENHFELDRAASGLKLMLWGLFKKVVIADRLSIYVTLIYKHPQDYSGMTLALATYFFAFQIYCDFSGYSDIAIGSARVLGFDLMQNFNLPYLSRSIPEFWSRWHISLSTWFKDYLYIPLGGNRCVRARWTFNILVTFLVSGLWHGANWTYLAWGGLHGIYFLIDRFTRGPRQRICDRLRLRGPLLTVLQVFITFHLVALAWIFFRANTLADAVFIIGRITTDLSSTLYLGPSQLTTFLSLLFIALLCIVQFLQSSRIVPLYNLPSRCPAVIHWTAYLMLVIGILIFGIGSNEFIYFQF